MEERRPAPLAETEGIPLIEEEGRIEKREVSTGRVRVGPLRTPSKRLLARRCNEDVVEVTRIPSGERLMQRPRCAPRTAS